MLGYLDAETAQAKLNRGDLDGAIETSRTAIGGLYPSGEGVWPMAAACLVVALLQRDAVGDIEAAQDAIERMATSLGYHGHIAAAEAMT